MRNTIAMALLCGFFVLLIPRNAHADLVTEATVQGQSSGCSNSGTSSASTACSTEIPIGFGSANFGGSAVARAAYGDLGTSASGVAGCTNVAGPYNCFEVNV